MLRRRPTEPLPLFKLIFLYKDRDIHAWILANPSKDPLNLLVLEKRQGTEESHSKPTAPVSGYYQFFDLHVSH